MKNLLITLALIASCSFSALAQTETPLKADDWGKFSFFGSGDHVQKINKKCVLTSIIATNCKSIVLRTPDNQEMVIATLSLNGNHYFFSGQIVVEPGTQIEVEGLKPTSVWISYFSLK